MANNIKIWRSNTSPDAAHALVLFCYKRSMKCKCSRRSSKRPDLSSPACLATAAICSAAKYRPPHAARLYSKLFVIISTNAMPPHLPANLSHRRSYISPNYLAPVSKTGAIGFNEYLNHTRLEHAKTLLKGYDLKVKKWRTPAALSTATTSAVCFVKIPNARRRNIVKYHVQLTENRLLQNKMGLLRRKSTLRTALITLCGSRRKSVDAALHVATMFKSLSTGKLDIRN